MTMVLLRHDELDLDSLSRLPGSSCTPSDISSSGESAVVANLKRVQGRLPSDDRSQFPLKTPFANPIERLNYRCLQPKGERAA